ncbi:signal transducing adapter molecule 1-like [Watersipora subatra]|uniref:signal transducing adapter molecule 1-like n=1 Tax=Watersipora subatra TaxID=2589382 RepID=UPI00355C5D2F
MSDTDSGPSSFDRAVEKATPDNAAEANWAAVLEICDKAGQSSTGSKDCLKSVMKRLSHSSKNIQLHALTLLDACILNCGSAFHKEVATAEFVKESRNILSKASPAFADKYKESLKKWAENEFKSDSKLSVIPTFYQALRSEGAYFGMSSNGSGVTSLSSSSAAVSTGGDEDLEKALALSLKESQSKSQSTSLYPSMSTLAQSSHTSNSVSATIGTAGAPPSEPSDMQVRALYDFEAVEENELTFKTGELIKVLDDSDPNWWKGSTWRGEGLFPVNFVTTDLTETTDLGAKLKKSVQFDEEVQVEQFDPQAVRIDEGVIDRALDHIQNADPTGATEDSTEMVHLEEECGVMGPLIDQELERTDSKHNELMRLNEKLTEAFQLYTQLMKEATTSTQYSSVAGYAQQTQPAVHSAYLPSLPAEAPVYTYNNQPESQPVYYNTAYPGQAQTAPGQPQPAQQITQASMLSQYGTTTMLNDLPYMPTATAPGMANMQPMYNAGQTSYP